MTHPDLLSHFEDQNCNTGPAIANNHGVVYRNCINGEECYLQIKEWYNSVSIMQACAELKIDAPAHLEDDFVIYKNFRKDLDRKIKEVEGEV